MRSVAGRCLECGAVGRFHRSGPKGELVCPACGVVYPEGVYPEPAPASVSGDAAFRTGGGRVLFEEARPDLPKPWFFRIRIRSKGPDGWRQTSDRRFIGDAGGKLYADSLAGAERSSPRPGITRIVAPVPGFKDVEWDVTYTDKEVLAPSLNVKPFPGFPEIGYLECGECGSTECEPMRRESTGSILCRCWSCGDWFYVYPEELRGFDGERMECCKIGNETCTGNQRSPILIGPSHVSICYRMEEL